MSGTENDEFEYEDVDGVDDDVDGGEDGGDEEETDEEEEDEGNDGRLNLSLYT